MPYAISGKVSTYEIAGGITISDAQYAAALAGMTNAADPKQVSVSGGVMSLITPSLPITSSLTMQAATTLPNITGGSRPPVNTGLARHPDGGWIVGDDGRVQGGTTFDAGLVHYNDGYVQQSRTRLATLGVGDNKFSVQGVAVHGGSVYAVAKDTDGTGTVIIEVELSDWSLVRQIDVPDDTNGLAVDYDRGQFLTLDDAGVLKRRPLSDGALTYQYPALGVGSPDMLHYLGGGKILITYGPNGTSGLALVADISTGSIVRERLLTMSGADAIEGAAVHNGTLYLNNDANFHYGNPELNRLLEYDVSGLL
ncbi:hypothetical protein [Maritimibacter sp. DP1N21-5]|uniref:hypothetical protein n=1 Tax=Maritimibacter sp. DP1N21-5 TaxID=2836867 RepID=UPI001C43BF1B|nr:hypothetical protein [Maritimibacter sp. DP1N21-5]MBV7408210.1 hypothetical protein [Maritimibacter sp. DP1N21-5]